MSYCFNVYKAAKIKLDYKFLYFIYFKIVKKFIKEKINFKENFAKLTANWHFSRFIILINLRKWQKIKIFVLN